MADEQGAIPEGMKAWTVWDAEARMAREGDWRGVAYSIAHDILPLIAEGSGDHAYQERARMQIKAADRLTAAIEAVTPKPPVDAGAMRERERIIAEARKCLRLTQGCMECNAEDERRWMDTIQWLESLA